MRAPHIVRAMKSRGTKLKEYVAIMGELKALRKL